MLQPTHFCHFEEPQSQVEFIRGKRSKLPVAPSITKRQRVSKKGTGVNCARIQLSLSLSLSLFLLHFLLMYTLSIWWIYSSTVYWCFINKGYFIYSHCKYFEMHIFNYKTTKIKSDSLYYKEFCFGLFFFSISDTC